MTDEPKELAQTYMHFSDACVECTTELAFQALVRQHARSLLPHISLLAVIGRIDLEHLELRRVVNVDHPPEHVARLGSTMGIADRPVVAHWLRATTPLVLDLPTDQRLMSRCEIEEIEHFKLGRLGGSTVLLMSSRKPAPF